MNKPFTLLAAALACLLTACSQEKGPKNDGPVKLDDPKDFNKEYYADDSGSGISFTAEADWTASVSATSKAAAEDDTWIDIEPKSGGAGPNVLTVTLQPNMTGKTREASVVIRCLGQMTTFVVRQGAVTQSGETPGVYYRINGSSEWTTDLEGSGSEPVVIQSLEIETRGGAVLTEEIVRRLAEKHLTSLDMGRAIYETHVFPSNTDRPDEVIQFSSLQSVVLPMNVSAIGRRAFESAPLTGIDLYRIDTIGFAAFRNCDKLVAAELATGLRSLGESAFEGSGLTEIALPQTLTAVGVWAFKGSALQTLTVEEGGDTLCIRTEAFNECQYLRNLNLGSREIHLQSGAFSGCVDLREIDLTNVTEIGAAAFSGCNLLIRANVAEAAAIGSSAFYQCTALTDITFGDKLTELGDAAFGGCSALERIYLPSSLETIGDAAFSGCAIEWIEIPENVREIGSRPFEGCDNLRNVTFKTEKLTRIPSNFLWGNRKITQVFLPESVEEIGTSAFMSCDELESIFLGSKVKFIGELALAHCYNLHSIVCKAPTPPECFNNEVFLNSGLTSQGGGIPNVVEIPTGSLSAYENDPNWNALKKHFIFHEVSMTDTPAE
ncbi:leucine-rich repeat protein [Rikenella microfusus]